MSHQSYVVGAGSGASLESNLAQPMDSRGNADQGMSISINTSGNQSHSFDGNTNQTTRSEVTSINANEGANVTSSSGTPKSFISRGDDLVNYKGIPTQAKVLETMGVLSMNTQGRYEFNAEASPEAPKESQSEPSDAHTSFAMTESENAEINNLIPTDLPPNSLSAITSHGIASVISGDYSSVINSLSKSSGQSPEQASATIGKVMEQYSKGAERYLEGTVGMNKADIPQFYEWAKQNAPNDLRGAVNKMVNQNQFRDLGKLVGRWAQVTPPSEEWLEKSGYKLGKSASGERTIHIEGFGEMTVRSAARSRFI